MNNRFYLQALGITGLFIVLLIIIWIASGGPASEAAVQNANSTRTAIASTQEFLLRPFPTDTPDDSLGIPETGMTGATSTSPPLSSPSNTSILPQTNTPISSPVSSSTPLPTQTASVQAPTISSPAASFTPLPTQTASIQLPTVTPAILPGHLQPTKAPPFGLRPETGVQEPVEFIHWYFERVWKERDYQNLWDNYLTASFKAHVGSGLFEDYAGWWNSVERVDVNSVDVIENNGANAWVRVNVTIHMKDGNAVPNQSYDYELLYDATRNTWMFDYK